MGWLRRISPTVSLHSRPAIGWRRRSTISACACAAAALCCVAASTAESGAIEDQLTPRHFDRLDASLNGGNGYKNATGSQLAWGESYVMLSYAVMFQVTGERRYLDKLLDHAESVLAHRDDRRGFHDSSGRSRPAWSVDGPFTVATLTLHDRAGRPALLVRSTRYAYNNETLLSVTARGDGRFDLTLENQHWKQRESFPGLSLEPGSSEFVERRVNAERWVAASRHVDFSAEGSRLVTVESAPGKHEAPAPVERIPLKPLSMAYHGYTGVITYPMLEGAWLARRHGRFNNRWAAVVSCAEESLRDAEEEWRDGPRAGEGYYVFGWRGCPFWADNVGKPFNYLCSMGRALVRAAQLTGSLHWRDRALALARLFKRHLHLEADGAYVWDYWWGDVERGWNRDNSPSDNTPTYPPSRTVEDVSHGHLDISFARLCAQAEWVFDAGDMHRFATTFVRRVFDSQHHTLRNRVDGSGGAGSYDYIAGVWAQLAPYGQGVVSAAVDVCRNQRQFATASPIAMLALARLLEAEKATASTGASIQAMPATDDKKETTEP